MALATSSTPSAWWPPSCRRRWPCAAKGCDLKIITDSVASAEAIVAFGREHGEKFEVWIEIDSDGHRSGIKPGEAALLDVARTLHEGGMLLGGVMTHAGSSYDLNYARSADGHGRAGARRLRAGRRTRARRGLSLRGGQRGLHAHGAVGGAIEGVTEVRAGVYVFFDLVMHNIGVCATDDIALSVLTTVIGHQADKGWAIVDAGWMAMSRDRGTQKQAHDFGYGQVCDARRRSAAGLCAQRRQPGARHPLARRRGRHRHRQRAFPSARSCASCPTTPAPPARSTPSTTR
jgi:D-serine deaminase-like pyridoxal phosphate-dependent protein